MHTSGGAGESGGGATETFVGDGGTAGVGAGDAAGGAGE